MSRRDFGRTLGLGALGAAAAPFAARSAEGRPARPNILFIIADNLGKEGVGFYGSTRVATPHIGGLARDGVVFDRCYIGTPLCCPARTGMMTGRFPQCVGLGSQPSPSNLEQGIPDDEVTLGEALRAAGYRTAVFGKWNLGYARKHLPTFHGFDTYYGINAGHADYYTHIYDRDGVKHFYRDAEKIDPEGYVDDLCADEAVRYIRAQRGSKEPFFIWHAFFTPHGPYQAPPGYDPNADVEAIYGFMIEHMDANVGRLLAAVDEIGAAENTLVVFISDQGSSHWNPYKRDLTEGGLQVVCAARWPGKTRAGTRIPTPVISYDWYTTCVTAGGGTMPEDRHIFGRDIAHLLRGEKRPPHDALFWSYGGDDAIRKGDWKLVLRKEEVAGLYDLSADPEEKQDRSADEPKRVEALKWKLLAWKKDPCAKPLP